MIREYVKKPVKVRALQYLECKNINEVKDFVGESLIYNPDTNEYFIRTLEGAMKCSMGDYIIEGVNGEFYPCKPDIFEKTYKLSAEELNIDMINFYKGDKPWN